MRQSKFITYLLILFFTFSALGAGTFIKGPALIEGFTVTASAAGTTTLTKDSETKQIITGSTTQIIVLPSATTIPLGRMFYVINKSTGTVTVNANGGSLVATVLGGQQKEFHLRVAGSAAGTWDATRILVDLSNDVTGALGLANGGTGQTTASAAINALVPTQTSNSGKFLTTNGTSVSWAATTASGDASINYIANGNGDVDTTGWAQFADSGSLVDGTGGSPTALFSNDSSGTIRGAQSFLYILGARWEGISYDFTIDPADKGKLQEILMDYTSDTNDTDGLMSVAIYDKTNAGFRTLSNTALKATGSTQFQYNSTWTPATNSTSYRFIIYQALATGSSIEYWFDNIKVRPLYEVSRAVSSVSGEAVVWSGTSGQILGRATGTGFAKLTAGVLSSQTSVSITSDVTGVLPLANGGTANAISATAGGVAYSTSSVISVTAQGSSGQVLHSNGSSAPSWVAVSASQDITGTLGADHGGTGAATLTANNVLLGNGTSAVQFVAPSTSGNVLTSNGTTWASASAGSTLAIRSVSSAYSATSSDATIIVTSSATVSLPAASGNSGKVFDLVSTGTAIGTWNTMGGTICGQSSVKTIGGNDSMRVQSDGSNYQGLGDTCNLTATMVFGGAASSSLPTSACTGTCVVANEKGNWSTTPTRGAQGQYSSTIIGFSLSPTCICTVGWFGVSTAGIGDCEATGTTTINYTAKNTSAALTDNVVQVSCYGRR